MSFLNHELNRSLEANCLKVLTEFGLRFGIDVENVAVLKRSYSWKFFSRKLAGIVTEFSNSTGTGKVSINLIWLESSKHRSDAQPLPTPNIICFWFTPKEGGDGFMLPPWEALPGSTRYTQGCQELYAAQWGLWLYRQTPQVKQDYEARFPKPNHVLSRMYDSCHER